MGTWELGLGTGTVGIWRVVCCGWVIPLAVIGFLARCSSSFPAECQEFFADSVRKIIYFLLSSLGGGQAPSVSAAWRGVPSPSHAQL